MSRAEKLEPEAYIQEIREVLRKPGSEDTRFRTTQFLRDADAWLSGSAHVQDAPDSLALLHVRVMRKLKDWGRVIERVRGEPWKGKKVRARALVEAATAHIHLQEFANADKCLREAVKLDGALEERVQRVRERLNDQLHFELYGRLSALVCRAQGAGDLSSAAHLYKSASHVFGLPSEVSERGLEVLGALFGQTNQADCPQMQRADDGGHLGRLVVTCGSGYSGTGAVTAYLRELEGLPMPFGVRELAVLKKNYGLYKLLVKWDQWSNEERMDALREMVLQAVLGVPCYQSLSIVNRLNTRSITWNSLFLGEGLDVEDARALGACCTRFVWAAMSSATSKQLAEACRIFLNRVLRLKDFEVGLFNNCIHQTQIRMCGLLDNAKVIVVIRDPRDQYVAHQTETPRGPVTVQAFIKKRKRADAAVRKYLSSGVGNVRSFAFESFVTDSAVREEVKSWAGLSGFNVASGSQLFSPDKSAKNVGIYRNWKNKPDIDAIEKELKDQLIEL